MLQRLRSPAALTGGTPTAPGLAPADTDPGVPGGAPARPGVLRSGAGPAGLHGHVPPLPIQINALQALCRQLFGLRLAMTALAAPFALAGAKDGLAAWLVGSAVLVTFMVSYVLLRDWERFGPVLLRHPSLLAVDMLFGALLLFTASPNSTLAIVTICTPLLAGLVYSWRGAGIFAALQILLLAGAYTVNEIKIGDAALLLVGLCVLAGAVGGTLRGLLLRFGAASQALTETRARLAVTEAVEGERARLAREMHDSVAKTLHGVALQADALATSADRMDPMTVKYQAELLARSARRAAAESRELLSDLRRASGVDGNADISAELAARTTDFGHRSGITAEYRPLPGAPLPALPLAVARQLLTIATEAMENAHRHAQARRVDVTAGIVGNQLRLSIHDDGRGLPPGTTLDGLRRAGHFGLVGMVERAASIGARIRIGRGRRTSGTEVRVDLPLAALPPLPPGEPAPPPTASAPAPPNTPALPPFTPAPPPALLRPRAACPRSQVPPPHSRRIPPPAPYPRSPHHTTPPERRPRTCRTTTLTRPRAPSRRVTSPPGRSPRERPPAISPPSTTLSTSLSSTTPHNTPQGIRWPARSTPPPASPPSPALRRRAVSPPSPSRPPPRGPCGSSSPTTIRWCAPASPCCSPDATTYRSWPRPRTAARPTNRPSCTAPTSSCSTSGCPVWTASPPCPTWCASLPC